MKKPWYENGIRFQCQGSGRCCVSRGEYGFVYMTKADRRRMAKALELSASVFTRNYCEKTDGVWHLKNNPDSPECLFLKNGHQCGIYKARPTQCRTWPFWPENMSAKAWKNDIARFCPGVGKGKLHSKQVIEKALSQQNSSEKELFDPSVFYFGEEN